MAAYSFYSAGGASSSAACSRHPAACVVSDCSQLTVGRAGLELCSCLTFTLPDPVLHGTMDCYSGKHLVTNCPFLLQAFTATVITALADHMTSAYIHIVCISLCFYRPHVVLQAGFIQARDCLELNLGQHADATHTVTRIPTPIFIAHSYA
jgi:hypothetical protein